MLTPKLSRLRSSREPNIAVMVAWSWEKTSRHLDLIEQQIGWAYEQRNDYALAILEEYGSNSSPPVGKNSVNNNAYRMGLLQTQ